MHRRVPRPGPLGFAPDADLCRHRRGRLPRLAPLRGAARARAPRDLRRQPRDGLAREHRAPARRRLRCSCNHDVTYHIEIDEPVDFVYHLAALASPIDYLRLPLHSLKVGSYGTHNALGLGEVQARPLPARVDERGVRRPAGAPAAGDVLGPRQPDRPARRLRRGEALRRGADDGVPPPAGRRHGDRPDLQHLRPADATERRSRDPELPPPGARREAADGLRRRLADAELLLRRRPDPRSRPARRVGRAPARSTSATRASSRSSSSPRPCCA